MVVEAATGQVVAEFREHVRPLADPRLSTFCTKLTGIQQVLRCAVLCCVVLCCAVLCCAVLCCAVTALHRACLGAQHSSIAKASMPAVLKCRNCTLQAQVDAADPFPAVFARACAFVERVLGGPGIAQPTGSGDSHPGASSSGTGSLGPSSSSSQPGASQSGSSQPASAIFVTCGDWDLQRMLPAQAGLSQLKVPPLWQRWCNLKMPYKAWAQGALPGGAPKWVDMVEMLQGLGMPLVGRHHCGELVWQGQGGYRLCTWHRLQRMHGCSWCPRGGLFGGT